MKTTYELIERISPRYRRVRNEKLDSVWEDFLEAVEKVTQKLTDDLFSSTNSITILYCIKEGEKAIYRKKVAKYCIGEEEAEIQYEEKDVPLGEKNNLEITFKDFRDRAKADKNLIADWFELEKLFESDEDNEIELEFLLTKIKL